VEYKTEIEGWWQRSGSCIILSSLIHASVEQFKSHSGKWKKHCQ